MLLSTGRVVVADSGPLIALGLLDRLALLPQLFAEVQVPRVVLAECLANVDFPDAPRIRAAVLSGILVPCEARPVLAVKLQAGECAAIGRALEVEATLLADDRAARDHARMLGLAVTGTLGVLVHAKQRGLIAALRPETDLLLAGRRYLGRSAIQSALVAVGEGTLDAGS